METKQIRVTVSGLAPGLLLHNPRSANPLDPAAKELSAVKKEYQANKTEEGLIAYLKAQFFCALYWKEGVGAYIPRGMVQATMISAAKAIKQEGKRASLARIISAAISPKGDSVLEITTPSKTKDDLNKMVEDSRHNFVIPAAIGTNLVPVSRPLFPEWSAKLLFNILDEDAIPLDTFKEIVEGMGAKGFGDWRPSGPTPGEYGMFSADKFEQSEDGGKTWKTV